MEQGKEKRNGVKPFKNKKFILCVTGVLAGGFIILAGLNGNLKIAGYYNEYSLKSTAQKYASSNEKAASPITISYRGADYYYVPFELSNGIISEVLPGLMLDSNGKPVISKEILKELFKYPGVFRTVASTRTEFDSLAERRAKAISQYCTIVNRQEDKLKKLTAFGTVGGVIYEGTKLAFDAVGLVKNAVLGVATFIKELAKSTVQDAIVKAVTPWDSRAMMESVNKSYNAARTTTTNCLQALEAWRSLKTTSGSITPERAANATFALWKMFGNEKVAIKYLREALERVNNYPRLVTQIGNKAYKDGITGLDNLIQQIEDEVDYWEDENQKAGLFLDKWANEQIRRVRK